MKGNEGALVLGSRYKKTEKLKILEIHDGEREREEIHKNMSQVSGINK